jgi:hypothetical protein
MTRINDFTIPPPYVGLGDTQGTENIEQLKKVLDDFLKNFGVTLGSGEGVQKPGEDQRPNLPPPDTDISSGDLATLLLKLKNEIDEKQLKGALEFIKARKDQIKQKHDERIKKILEAAEESKKADKAGKWMKVLKWVGFALTVAVAIGACILTGGLATGPVVCALLAGAMLLLEKTGAMEKIMEGLTWCFEKAFELCDKLNEFLDKTFGNSFLGSAALLAACGVMPAALPVVVLAFLAKATKDSKFLGMDRKQLAQICAVITIALITIVVARGSVAGLESRLGSTLTISRLSNLVQNSQKLAKLSRILTVSGEIALDATAVGGGIAGGVKGYYDSKALEAQAEAKEILKFIVKFQQQLKDEQDRIKELIEQMQANVSIVLEILKSEAQTREVIAKQTMI